MNKFATAGAAALAAGLINLGLLAPATAEEVPLEKVEQAIKYRQNVMGTMAGLLGTAIGQLRDGFGYGPDLNAVAAGLAAVTKDIPALFPEGTDVGETKAKAGIWSDADGFAAKSKDAEEAAAAFAEAVSSGDKKAMLGAFKAVGDSCKGCHEKYRAE